MYRQPARVATIAAALCVSACAGSGTQMTSASKPAPVAAQPLPQKSSASLHASNLDAEIRRAQILRAQGNSAEAIRALAQLVLVAPDDSRVVGEYGKALVQQGRPDDAVAFLKRAIQLREGDWSLYSALGVAYDQRDD